MNGAAPVELAQPEAQRRRSPLKRLGCGLALLAWFAFLMTPCALFYLAANGEIRLEHSDIPQPRAHPRLLISLVSEQDDRGLRIESANLAAGAIGENDVCVETAVTFLLWQASEGSQDVRYCDCYQRADDTAPWALTWTSSHACSSLE